MFDERPVEDRLAWVERPNRWVKHKRGELLLERLESILNAPKSDRMPNLLIIGDTNNGKTALLRHFEKMHPRESRPDEDVADVPVLYMQAPAISDEGRFYDDILEKLYAPMGHSFNVGRRQHQAYAMMKTSNVRMLIIDDVHNLIAGAMAKHRVMLNVLRHLGNELQIPIVCAGIDAAFHALESDPQLGNRFAPALVPRWKLDDPAFPALLKGFENDFELAQPSNLADPKLAAKIFGMASQKTIGHIGRLLVLAAKEAIQSGVERITPRVLDTCGFVSEHERHILPSA